MLISVLTATLNRVADLKKLYKSLEGQTNKAFEWLIVDDGSTDSTRKWVEEVKKQSSFVIKYIYETNSGKHIAINKGMRYVSGEVTVLIDSDDIALPTMIEDLCKEWSYTRLADSKLAMIVFERVNELNQPLKKIPNNGLEGNYNEIRYGQGLVGDYAESFKTEILKSYKFPKFGDERFLSEEYLWMEIGKVYNARFVDKGLYRTVYPVNGLTNNSKKNMWMNPQGIYNTQKKKVSLQMPVKLKIKSIGVFLIVGWRLHKNPYQNMRKLKIKILAYLLTIPALGMYLKYKMRFKNER